MTFNSHIVDRYICPACNGVGSFQCISLTSNYCSKCNGFGYLRKLMLTYTRTISTSGQGSDFVFAGYIEEPDDDVCNSVSINSDWSIG